MKYLGYALAPLAVLITASALACVVGYWVVLISGDVFPLDKVIGKIGKLFLVLSILPLMYALKLSVRDLGFARRPVFFRQLLQGLGLGLVTLLPVLIVLYALGVNVIDVSGQWTPVWLFKKLLLSLLLALLISCAEEPLFRGVLVAGLKDKLPLIAVLLISSIYYASLHFLHSHSRFSYDEITFFTGFVLLGEAFANVFRFDNIPPFSALLMVGVFLALLRTRIDRSLGLCIGCHTAWVWQIKMNKALFNVDSGAEYFYLVSAYDGVIGPLVSVWLLFVIAVFWVVRKLRGAQRAHF
ncbi:MAG: CPBP family intramembrane metalloprotease domain-containing protein [Gammaproteobacteria bacterium HGW-Gammaproteobacteria-3]|nr:MAG: CPBP family intramembrane metalloprotease domain-containing protein [Gammaproteobacteria bacterium HGW-Gammaproteobacteria-3]